MKTFPLPLLSLPLLRMGCRNPMSDRNFETEYRGSYFTLHYCGYEGNIRIGQNQYALKAGDITFTPAGLARSYDLRRAGHHLLLAFVLHAKEGREKRSLDLPLHFSPGGAAPLARMRFFQVMQVYARSNNDPWAVAQARVLLQELLLWLAQEARVGFVPENRALDRSLDEVVAVMERNYHRSLTVASLAAEVGLSQNYLARCFKRRYGATLQRYLLNLRMKLAHDLLLSSNLPVKMVGVRVGLPNPQHFDKQFRKMFGKSPGSLRGRV